MSVFEKLKSAWPSSIVSRGEIAKFSGGLLNSGTMANYDYLGTGPKGRLRCGRKIVYQVDELIAWLESRTSQVEK